MVNKNERIPEGIGGWLLLPTTGFFIGIVVYLFLAVIMGLSLISGGGGFWEAVYLIIAIVNIPLIAFILYLEFKKKKEFPKWAIIFTWFGILVSFLFSIEEIDYPGILRDFLIAIIWTMYFLQSKRVKNTFVK